jgi:hypothetical protein
VFDNLIMFVEVIDPPPWAQISDPAMNWSPGRRVRVRAEIRGRLDDGITRTAAATFSTPRRHSEPLRLADDATPNGRPER